MSGRAQVLAGPDREALRGRLEALGFDEVRFARGPGEPDRALGAWLAAGMHAGMGWLERTAAQRADARLVLPGLRSVIALGVNYGPGGAAAAGPADGAPRWARYALHDDYHDTLKPGLEAAGRLLEEWGAGPEDYRYYVDTGPVLERGWAARAGLGFLGKNAMLISRRHGNWLFLAVILTRLEIVPDTPPGAGGPEEGAGPVGRGCGKCTRCLAACPTGAFARPGVVDARRCIAYQTIENPGIIPRALRMGLGDSIFGCDRCLEVCPWNRRVRAGRRQLLVGREELAGLGLAELLELTPERFAAVFRRTGVKRLKLAGLLRNACVVAGNSGAAAHLPALVRLAGHDSAVVRAHAVWAVQQLAGPAADRLLAAAAAREADPQVQTEHAAGGGGAGAA